MPGPAPLPNIQHFDLSAIDFLTNASDSFLPTWDGLAKFDPTQPSQLFPSDPNATLFGETIYHADGSQTETHNYAAPINFESFHDFGNKSLADTLGYQVSVNVLDASNDFVDIVYYDTMGNQLGDDAGFVVAYNPDGILVAIHNLHLNTAGLLEQADFDSGIQNFLAVTNDCLNIYVACPANVTADPSPTFGITGPSTIGISYIGGTSMPEASGASLMLVATVAFFAARWARRFV